MAIIEAEELTKVFAHRRRARRGGRLRRVLGEPVRTVAVDRVTFAVERGTTVGYIGLNGAGTT